MIVIGEVPLSHVSLAITAGLCSGVHGRELTTIEAVKHLPPYCRGVRKSTVFANQCIAKARRRSGCTDSDRCGGPPCWGTAGRCTAGGGRTTGCIGRFH